MFITVGSQSLLNVKLLSNPLSRASKITLFAVLIGGWCREISCEATIATIELGGQITYISFTVSTPSFENYNSEEERGPA